MSWELLWHTLQLSLNISFTALEKLDLWTESPVHFGVVTGCTIVTKSQNACLFTVLDVRNTISPYFSLSLCLRLPVQLLDCCFPLPTTMINPLTTDDAFWRRQILAACYKLAQSVLKIGSALAERWDSGSWMGPPFCLTAHGGSCSCLYSKAFSGILRHGSTCFWQHV